MKALSLILCLLAALSPVQANAAASCAVHLPYAGKPLHPAIALPAAGPIPERPLPAERQARLDAAFGRLQALTGAPAITAAIGVPGEGLWQRTVAPSDAPLLYWASAGKAATAVLILQLVEEGKLSLDDPVSRWVKGVPNGALITVRDLLAHTSGLYSGNEDPAARAKPKYRALNEDLAIVRRHGPLFCPGTEWRYSNSGYLLLGEIVRQVDGQRIDQAITKRIIAPLGLKSMRAIAPGEPVLGVASLHSASGVVISPGWPGAAGPIASDAADMVRFWNGLLSGRLLPRSRVTEMIANLYPMFDSGTYYGLGIMLFDVADADGRLQWLGHAGGTPGAGAIIAYSIPDRMFVGVALTGDGSAVASANYLLKALR